VNLFVAGGSPDPAPARAALEAVVAEIGVLDPARIETWRGECACAAWVQHDPERIGGVRHAAERDGVLALFAGRPVDPAGSAGLDPHRLAAADALAAEGIETEVIDPRTVAPIDITTILESVHKTGRLLIVDEDFGPAGIGAEISAQVTEQGFDDLDAPIRRLNGLQTPVPYSPPLEAAVVPSRDQIAAALRDLARE